MAPIAPAELAAGFPASDALRRQFTNGMMVIALADGPPQVETIALVIAFTKALGIAEPVLYHKAQAMLASKGVQAI